MAMELAAKPTSETLSSSLSKALAMIDAELAAPLLWRWWRADPERRKALSRAREYLQTILQGKHRPEELLRSAQALVERAGEPRSIRNRENAWDFAEQLRECSFAFLEDEALRLLLLKEAADTSSVNHETLFGSPVPKELLAPKPVDGFRTAALELLVRVHKERVDRVRHDRARDKLWQSFVWKLIPVVGALLAACILLQLERVDATLLRVCAGALGSVLSAVLKLRDSEQRIRHLRRSASFLLLQPMLGATAALVVGWIGIENVLDGERFGDYLAPAVGFLAGFSEPFFLSTLAKLSDLGSSDGKSGKDDADAKGGSQNDSGPRRKGH